MTIPQQLRAAAGEVRKGWTQHVLEDSDGNVCAIGSVNRVVNGCAIRHDLKAGMALGVLSHFIRQSGAGDSGLTGTADWNNHPLQTKERVAQTMEQAAALYELEHPQEKVCEAESYAFV